ncbi:puff-specific protein Bx42 [Thecamonas trahens ATCC 50062]|uniref:Puff-specific protein Bx42 n=1 Tax=Thecamonas trahens ATCC 50062 TaxID=461836 RepID=A0A0L0DCB1_THETB|nr:puff-specific protein Bx42 [Thecamonas trahens ATCC 50062]KNC49875.1 puff-specific protein Bx42 [Thecamonas trahens ATCC 50062]|eukprot:XP_013757359.1 puff-specific protein Bx42 [Thecamonas trahens ATCC 50062]
MSSLASLLPAPTRKSTLPAAKAVEALPSAGQGGKSKAPVPAYGQRANSGWVPRTEADYDDGGAYPEIHVDQTTSTLAATVDASGTTSWDAVARAGHSQSVTVYSGPSALIEAGGAGAALERPSADDIAANVEATRNALMNVKHATMTDARVRGRATLGDANMVGNATFVKYTPPTAAAAKTGIRQRVIQMVDMPVDALEPSRFRHKKRPGGRQKEAPVPILHSPEHKPSKAEKANLNIPPAISNWKNPRGDAVPLDKRLAFEGRGLVAPAISDKFAKLTDALQIAEAAAREQVEAMAKVEKQMKLKEQAKEDETLREVAREARERRRLQQLAGPSAARAGAAAAGGNPNMVPLPPRDRGTPLAQAAPLRPDLKRKRGTKTQGGASTAADDGAYSYSYSYSYSDNARPAKLPRVSAAPVADVAAAAEDSSAAAAPVSATSRAERDAIREERRKQRERERRRAASGQSRDATRDISELVALGRAKPTASADAMYDQRLFNRAGGLGDTIDPDKDGGAGFSGSLFAAQRQRAFVPSAETIAATASKAFTGSSSRQAGRPVEFEKHGASTAASTSQAQPTSIDPAAAPAADPYGLSTFMSSKRK